MVGAAIYFVLSAHEGNGLPPVVLAAGGLVVGGRGAAARRARRPGRPDRVDRARSTYAGTEVPWWLPVLGLGVVTCAVAYVTGIAASRALGSRLASFVALLEVLFALVFAWLLLGELPRADPVPRWRR